MRRSAIALLCAVLAGCQARKNPAVLVDPSLAELVPSDTVFVAGANIEAIRETPVYQKLLSRLPVPQLEEFARKTGLDPRRDLAAVLSSTNGKHALLVARGKFRTSDVEARLEANGAPRFSYKQYRLFGSEQGAVFFLSPTTAVAGPASELRSLIDSRRGSGRGLPASLTSLLAALPAGDQIYAALTGGIQGLNLGIPENSNLSNITQVLESMNSATIGMDLRNGVNLVAMANCKTERDAKFVHDMLRGVIGFGRLNTPDGQPELLKLYDAIQVTQLQSQTRLEAAIPADLADRFLDLWLKSR